MSSLEFDIINSAGLGALRAGLKDRDPVVRYIAARALGIRGDKDSAEALAELVKTDPESMVRVRAVESLGLLKMKLEVIELARKDGTDAVQWVARMAAGSGITPSRSECITCHSAVSGGVLTFNTWHLNGSADGKSPNQLERFAKAG